MTVKDMIYRLAQFAPNNEVRCWSSFENGEATDSPANTVIIKDVHLGSDDLTVFIGVTIRNT